MRRNNEGTLKDYMYTSCSQHSKVQTKQLLLDVSVPVPVNLTYLCVVFIEKKILENCSRGVIAGNQLTKFSSCSDPKSYQGQRGAAR